MKKFLCLVIFISLIFSCASGPGPSEGDTSVSSEKIKEPKLVAVRAPRLLEMISYFSDGDIDEITDYTYEGDSIQPVKEETYDAYNKLQEKSVYKYDDAKLMVKEYYDSYNSLVSSRNYTYDGQRNMIQEAFADDEGKTIMIFDYEYNGQGKKIQWKISSETTGLLAVTDYVYKNDLISSIISYDTGGEVAESFEYTYKNKLADTFNHYDASHNLLNYTKYEYDSIGNMTRQLKYRKNDSISTRMEYQYDDDGNVIAKTVFDGNGKVKQSFTYEYEMVQTKVWTIEY